MRRSRGRIWRVIMILVFVPTWNTMCLLLGVGNLGGCGLPYPETWSLPEDPEESKTRAELWANKRKR